MDRTKMTRINNTSNLLYTLSSLLSSWQYQLRPYHQERVGHARERVTENVSCKGEVGNAPEGGGRTFEQYPEGGTVGVAREGDTTNPGYITFDPSGISTITWKPTGSQVS